MGVSSVQLAQHCRQGRTPVSTLALTHKGSGVGALDIGAT